MNSLNKAFLVLFFLFLTIAEAIAIPPRLACKKSDSDPALLSAENIKLKNYKKNEPSPKQSFLSYSETASLSGNRSIQIDHMGCSTFSDHKERPSYFIRLKLLNETTPPKNLEDGPYWFGTAL